MASASDAFTGTGALSGSWTTQFGTPARVTDTYGGADSINGNAAFYSGITWTADHSSQAKIISGLSSTAGYCQVNARASGTGASPSYYELYTDGATGASGHTDIGVVVAGSETILQGLGAFAANDTMYIEAVGTTIKAKKNGVQTGTNQTDSSLAGAGAPGLSIYPATPRMDDWAGADIGGGGAVVNGGRRALLGVGI